MKKCILFFFACILSSCTEITNNHQSILGTVDLSHPALLKMHNSNIIQRLKKIDQSGTPGHYCNMPSFTRYDHSMGVLYLVQRYGGDTKEQLAALTHDASHTVFSHVADKLFDTEGYQDKIHEQSLKYLGAEEILNPFGISLHDINPEQDAFKRQEQPLPDMCADRIEYNIHTARVFNILNDKDVKEILDHLYYRDEKWYFDSISVAKKFAKLSLVFTEKFWGSKENVRAYYLTTKILKKALKLDLFSNNDFHYATDDFIIQKINESNDPEIQFYLNELKNINMSKFGSFSMPNNKHQKSKQINIKPKFRGIDPLVLNNGKFNRLTHLSTVYKKEYYAIKNKMNKGFVVSVPIFEGFYSK